MKLILRVLISLILPFMVTITVPLVIIINFNLQLLTLDSLLSVFKLIIGILLVIIGLGFFISTNKLFIIRGRGTLAPWDPPENLVVTGAHAHLRNPMIAAVTMILLGESLIFSGWELLLWTAFFFTLNHIYIVYKEEVDLTKKFGEEYLEYMDNVPRWIPRLKLLEKINK